MGDNLVFYLGKYSFIYSSEANEPEVTVKDGENILIENTDYNLEYSNNINAGTGSVKITGLGKYEGVEKIIEFLIEPLSIFTANVDCGKPDELTGCYNLENLNISIGKLQLEEGIDYNKEIEETIDGHFVTSIITFRGIGNFADQIKKSFLTDYTGIIRKDINKLLISAKEVEFNYDGKEKNVNLTITDNINEEYILVENVDYSVEYEDNVNAGTSKVFVNGISDVYYGTYTMEIKINPISIENGSLSCGAKDEEGFYDTKNVTLSVNYKILSLGKDFVYKVESVVEEKYVYAIITVTGIGNYTGTISGKFITGKFCIEISSELISLSKNSFAYTGLNIIPEIITELELDKDYIVEFPTESKNIGNYSVIVTGIGSYSGTINLEYVISSLTIDDAEISFGEPDDAGFYEISNMVVSIGDMILEKLVDYKYKVIEEEIEEGYMQSTCTITGINNFSGSKTVSIITSRKEKYAGKEVRLEKVILYPRYGTIKSNIEKSGIFYLWDDKIKNGRIRITNNLDGIKKPGYITGWVNVIDLEPKEGILVGDKVLVNGDLNTYADGKGNTIIKKNAIMYVTDKLDPTMFEYNYGVATDLNRTRQGWVKEESIKKYER